MRAVIITNGEIGDPKTYDGLFRAGDLIICADGGYRHCKTLGITPHLVLGDFDSLPSGTKAKLLNLKIMFKQFPVEKDFTDTELAVQHALGAGADEIMLLGGTGSRVDHTFANLMLLASLAQNGIKAQLLNDKNDCRFILDSMEITARAGEFVSFIPATPEVFVEYTDGFHYPLRNQIIRMGSSLGISNYLDRSPGFVKIRSGVLMVVIARD